MKLTAPKQRQGEYFENLACQYLQAQGLTLVAKNWHYKNMGELDLIMVDDSDKFPGAWPCLVIIEVRQRSNRGFGGGLDSITASKRRKLIKTTQMFLQLYPQFEVYAIRFDIVSFDCAQTAAGSIPTPIWVQQAFDAT